MVLETKFHPILNRVALIFMGATFFMSCNRNVPAAELDKETLISMQSTDLTVLNSANGNLSYRFETPLLERYELAEQPFMEFRKGIKVISYNDSTHLWESELIADYAKYIEPLELWEARGNVVATNAQGQVLETEQLFWDEKSDRIYSNVESKVTEGDDITIGDGFETDSRFDNYRIRNPRGQVLVDTEPNRDSTRMQTLPPDSLSGETTPISEPSSAPVSRSVNEGEANLEKPDLRRERARPIPAEREGELEDDARMPVSSEKE